MEQATELEYLRWFYANADFGPAERAVRYYMNQDFTRQTGKGLPDGYKQDEE
ncbi:hypothetical protein [Bordetella trematum]|uniref:hypothetical protein n=1 Tax=Bordetella trematum TaxID=123899 RepID=UPI0039896F45